MTKYECAVDYFKNQNSTDKPILEALHAGQEAIELLFALRYENWVDRQSLINAIDNLLKEWD